MYQSGRYKHRKEKALTLNAHKNPSIDTSDHKPRRFADQRGIALQTVIIMVVMLAIAGGVAAVLLTRGQQASQQLEDSALAAPADTYTIESFCKQAGHFWDSTHKCMYQDAASCTSAGGTYPANTANADCTIGGNARGKIKGTTP